MQNIKNLELCLTNTYLLNQRMRHLEFKIVNNITFYYKAGQFISLNFKKNEKIISRNFSIANSPDPNGTNIIEIAATFVPNGIASSALWDMKIGDHINANGPYGTFILPQQEIITNKRYILIATGTGVTPYRAMLNCFKEKLNKDHTEIILLLGVRNSSELLYKEDFVNFAKEKTNFKFIACYSREQSNHKLINNFNNHDHYPSIYPTQEYFGYVQDRLAELDINPEIDLVYLCGNPNMVDQALSTLETLGMPKSKVRREKYISSK